MRKKSGVILSIMVFCATVVLGQNVEFKASNFKEDKEGFKKAVEDIKSGDEFLEIANEAVALVKSPELNFKRALLFYHKAYLFNPNDAELNMKIGNCYLYTTEKYKAKEYLVKASELKTDMDPMLHFYLGQSYQLNEEFDKAIKEYTTFEAEARNKYVAEYKVLTVKYKKECKYGKELVAKKLRLWVDNLETINSEQDEHSPCLSTDGELLIYSSNRKNSHTPNDLGIYDGDIYQSTFDGKKWSKPQNLGEPLSTEIDETASALSYDGQRMLLFRVENGNADVFESKLRGLDWSSPVRKMGDVPNTTFNETYACYEPNDIKIHYVFDGKGNQDINFSGIMARNQNTWGKGQSAGADINTQFHEGSVYIHPDGETMYFSSQGHNSMGGYDIFMITRNYNTKQWNKPVNLGYPINTPYDEKFFVPTASGKLAYIASNRDGGKGGLDLYKVTFWGEEKPVSVGTEDFLLASTAEPIRDNNIQSPVKVQKKSLTVFKGNVIDHLTRQPVYADLEIVDNSNGSVIAVFASNSATGKFLLSLTSGKNYGIAVNAKGYLFHSENFNIPELSEYNMVNKVIELKNIAIGSKIALRNVFFATGKSDITSDSFTELNRLVQLLKDIPKLKIELAGHTDNLGNEDLNKKLSEDRATAVMNYLIKSGINKDRLQAMGYASSRPIAPNTNDEGRQLNRRTEFEIIAN